MRPPTLCRSRPRRCPTGEGPRGAPGPFPGHPCDAMPTDRGRSATGGPPRLGGPAGARHDGGRSNLDRRVRRRAPDLKIAPSTPTAYHRRRPAFLAALTHPHLFRNYSKSLGAERPAKGGLDQRRLSRVSTISMRTFAPTSPWRSSPRSPASVRTISARASRRRQACRPTVSCYEGGSTRPSNISLPPIGRFRISPTSYASLATLTCRPTSSDSSGFSRRACGESGVPERI